MTRIIYLALIGLIVGLGSCAHSNKQSPAQEKSKNVREIIDNAVIYEVNIRQFTPEGSFNAFTDGHLERLSNLGVDILWIMPIHPISEKNRKGTLGSYYAVADYKDVNPEFGTKEDFQRLVDKAHELGMYVILDWVANHTGWDNWWITEYPEWYLKNEKGEIISPIEDWSDVAGLDYENIEMRAAMIDALNYWVEEFNIDGYRCDVAGMVPEDFWHDARQSLDSIKPVFMLAEAWEPELMERAFDMAYGWDFHHVMNAVAKGEKDASEILAGIEKIDSMYEAGDILMHFITNHDENSWNGTVEERMGEAGKCFAALSYIMPGMPLIYSGQEANLNHRLEFFEKDQVNWSDTSSFAFYRQLNQLKETNKALAPQLKQQAFVKLAVDNPNIIAFQRKSGQDDIVAIFNFSNTAQSSKVQADMLNESYTNVFSKEKISQNDLQTIDLDAWGFLILQ